MIGFSFAAASSSTWRLGALGAAGSMTCGARSGLEIHSSSA
jgi:hypothetical protein